MRALALASALMLATPAASKEDLPALSAGELNEFCTSRADTNKCGGYIWGFSDGISFMTPRAYCPRPSVSSLQIEIVVRQYLASHPALWDLDAGDVVKRALRETFPCSSRARPK
jgi:hypothetical protein